MLTNMIAESKIWIDLAGLIITFLGVVVGGFLTYQANRIAKSNFALAKRQQEILDQKIDSEKRNLFLSNYKKISKALGIVMRDGEVSGEAEKLFWQARDDARLELPNRIRDYTQMLFDLMQEAHLLGKEIQGEGRLEEKPEREKASKRKAEIINQLLRKKPSEVYREFMKISE